jgi:signal recognition particle subunit SRP9
MFIDDWNSFYEQAEQLYRSDPLRTRYVMKYKHTSGKVVLKVTDDRVVSSWWLFHHLLMVLLGAIMCVGVCSRPSAQS